MRDLANQRFGRLLVIKEEGRTHKKKSIIWLCRCDCGKEKLVPSSLLCSGRTKSCGCLNDEKRSERVKTHGFTGHVLHNKWRSMHGRCYNLNNKRYDRYGGRGIKICDEWLQDFMPFYNWSMENGWRVGLTIDRINNDGNYEPSNCRWTTMKEQARNRRTSRIITCRGMTMTLAAFAELVGEKSDIIHFRMRHGWTEEEAIFTPFRRKKNAKINAN